jgi:hypothetical protein
MIMVLVFSTLLICVVMCCCCCNRDTVVIGSAKASSLTKFQAILLPLVYLLFWVASMSPLLCNGEGTCEFGIYRECHIYFGMFVLFILVVEIGAALSFKLKNKLTIFHWILYASIGVLSKVDVYTDVSCIIIANECGSLWFVPLVSLFCIGSLLGQCGPGCTSAVFLCHLRYVDDDSDYVTIYRWLDFHLLSELFRSEAGAEFKERIAVMYGSSFCYSLWKLGAILCQLAFMMKFLDLDTDVDRDTESFDGGPEGFGSSTLRSSNATNNDPALTLMVSIVTGGIVVGYSLAKGCHELFSPTPYTYDPKDYTATSGLMRLVRMGGSAMAEVDAEWEEEMQGRLARVATPGRKMKTPKPTGSLRKYIEGPSLSIEEQVRMSRSRLNSAYGREAFELPQETPPSRNAPNNYSGRGRTPTREFSSSREGYSSAELNRYGADPLQPVALEHALSQAEGRPDLEVVGLSDLAAKDPHRTLTRVRSRGSMGEGWCEIISYNTRFALKLVRCCSF